MSNGCPDCGWIELHQDAVNEARWLVEHEGGEAHVKPINDLRPHISSIDCWCNPTPIEHCPSVINHRSMDLREEYERGRKLS